MAKRRTVFQLLQHWLRKRVWNMDIADSAWIAPSAYIDRTNPRGIHIEDNCVVDLGAIILSHDTTRGLRPHTRLGARSLVGARAIIMPGVTVGKDCQIAPGSVVLADLPDGAMVRGNPAKQHPDS